MSTKIEWCTETWNPIVGCTKVSPGCDNCYAEKMAYRLAAMAIANPVPDTIGKYVRVIKGRKWEGTTVFDDITILKPLSWKKPRMIFVCSMGDLFHESVSIKWIDMVMSMAALLPRHIFIILTKRPEKMFYYFKASKDELIVRWSDACYEIGVSDKDDDVDAPPCWIHNRLQDEWPMKNLWLGVTAENQYQANIRVPVLLSIPAAMRFVSAEPMLTKIDLVNVYGDRPWTPGTRQLGYIDWVICGGESGPGARPVHPDWVRFLQIQCHMGSVPFFFKGWGEWLPSYDFGERLDELVKNFPKTQIRKDYEFPDGIHMYKVGKKAAGALLDGKEYKEYPKS